MKNTAKIIALAVIALGVGIAFAPNTALPIRGIASSRVVIP